ncbi:hypothetical protein ACNUDN_30360 [Mycobacterium sp. smrl_JER01]|uniref:hypothetical protein n=1 Tax=Mycobacterium sp. smrl_JER01 TaxID=3402633 RepID=UPI003AD66B6E
MEALVVLAILAVIAYKFFTPSTPPAAAPPTTTATGGRFEHVRWETVTVTRPKDLAAEINIRRKRLNGMFSAGGYSIGQVTTTADGLTANIEIIRQR